MLAGPSANHCSSLTHRKPTERQIRRWELAQGEEHIA